MEGGWYQTPAATKNKNKKKKKKKKQLDYFNRYSYFKEIEKYNQERNILI
jgi:hypothetical protein